MGSGRQETLGSPKVFQVGLLCMALTVALMAGAVPAAAVTSAAVPTADRPGALPIDRDPRSALALAVQRSTSLGADDRVRLRPLTDQPSTTWVTGPATTAVPVVRAVASGAALRGTTPVFALYRIPSRDCGHHSRLPEAVSIDGYSDWLRQVIGALGSTRAVVVIEPDALAQIDCLSAERQTERLTLLRTAVAAVEEQGSWAYIDAGHAGWTPVADMASRLRAAGAARASGFAVGVAGFGSTTKEIAYGARISDALGGTHFLIDTSRNGAPVPSGEWCNPLRARSGALPTWRTGEPLVDAYLWIKTPGLSDGPCNGGPAAGTFWPEGALRLLSPPSS